MPAPPGSVPDPGHDLALLVPDRADPPSDVPFPIFRLAARAYDDHSGFDMLAIARELGIGRATLYRNAGPKDQLLGSVLWWRARVMLAEALEKEAHLTGVERVAALNDHLLDETIADAPLQRLLHDDPDLGFRVLTGAAGRVQSSVTAFFAALIRLEAARGTLRLGMDGSALAYALVRLDESFLYADLIAGRERDMEQAKTVTRALLVGVDLLAGR